MTPPPPMENAMSQAAPAALAGVIVNFRTPGLTIAAARSVLDELAAHDGRLVIVDNHSEDGSAAALARFRDDSPHRQRIALVLSARNGGFAAGVNLGIGAVAADFYLLVNSDAGAEPGAVSAMLAAARANPKTGPSVGVVTPCLTDMAGAPQCARFRRHTPLSEFLDGAQTGPLSRLFPGAEAPIAPDDWTTPPDWVSFAAVLLSAKAIAAAGPMDEGYFLYFEDCDYCRRITRAGFAIAAAPAARFRHQEGASTKIKQAAAGGRAPAYYYRARNRYFRRHFGPLGPLAANLAWLAGRALARLRGIAGRPAPVVSRGRAGDLWIGWRG